MSGVGIQTYTRPQSLYRFIMVSGVMASPPSRLHPLELFTTSHSVWKFITAVIPSSCFIFTVTCSTWRGQLPSHTLGSTLAETKKNTLAFINNLVIYVCPGSLSCKEFVPAGNSFLFLFLFLLRTTLDCLYGLSLDGGKKKNVCIIHLAEQKEFSICLD